MRSNNLNSILFSATTEVDVLPGKYEDYGALLDALGLHYKIVDYYLQVGEITRTQGWILHLSVIITQIDALLEAVIPVLAAGQVPFKLIIDKETTKILQNGNLGIKNLGKTLCIYPENDEMAIDLAKKLVGLTKFFEGPRIPTDIHLGNAVYSRYGSFNPIIISDIKGNKEKFIYDAQGQLIKDDYLIPFQLPVGIAWPFEALAQPVLPKPKTVFKSIYKPLFTLKSDTKGNVYRGIYYKGIFKTGSCVIKQGIKNMAIDEFGRDIHDRLVWQMESYKDLVDEIPLPKILDLFQEDGDTYLVMEYIKGPSLYDRIKMINYSAKTWFQLSIGEKTEILDYILQIVSIIERLHKKGYVHRDMAPGNFLIGKNGQILLIDMELAYSSRREFPTPPFQYGTHGFMSSNQQSSMIPTAEDDIYGLGALLIILFTGLTPIRFSTIDKDQLMENLSFFIGDSTVGGLISECMDREPLSRPKLATIQTQLEQYKQSLRTDLFPTTRHKTDLHRASNQKIALITAAIKGLGMPPMVMKENLWYSKIIKNEAREDQAQQEYTRYIGLHTGISGVLYLLSRARRMGIEVSSCQIEYTNGWAFIEAECVSHLPNIIPGLYRGAAGIALSLSEGIRSGFLQDDMLNRQRILACLSLPNRGLDLETGITGQGIAILQCRSYLDQDCAQNLLTGIIAILLETQQNDGSWAFVSSSDHMANINFRFGNGIPGIVWFLLEYDSIFPEYSVQEAALKALDWLLKKTQDLKALFNNKVFKEELLGGYEKGDERKGILLTFIKAYETFRQKDIKTFVETALIQYPSCMVKTNFSLDTGLAGLGEIYLEAARVFGNNEWQQRAEWIADVFMHTFFQNGLGSGHWLMEENFNATADLMVGNSGIIHFLLRCLDPKKIGYRLLQ